MKKRIGIVGGGQLGRMLTQAAQKLGFFVTVLDPLVNSPAGQVADAQIVGSYKDAKKISELAEVSDFITFEIESANATALQQLLERGISVNPEPKILEVIKDKLRQKIFLRGHGVAVADFIPVDSVCDCTKLASLFGYPFLLKARFDAYDGRGNIVVTGEDQVTSSFKKLSSSSLYAERFVPYTKELAVICARGVGGEIVSYPVVETIHKNNICHMVRSPAPVLPDISTRAKVLAEQTLRILGGVGVFAIEMFLTDDGTLLVNEIAPRVHNSGHHTIEAFQISQFELHIRAITGMPIMQPVARSHASVMVNILGEREGCTLLNGGSVTQDGGRTITHIYGKLNTRSERKMGHITVLANTVFDAEKVALKTRGLIQI